MPSVSFSSYALKLFGTQVPLNVSHLMEYVKNVFKFQATGQARRLLVPLCHCAITGALSPNWGKNSAGHTHLCVTTAICLYRSFLTSSPISLILSVFPFSFFICTSPISQSPTVLSLLSQSLFFLFDCISLSCFPWMSDPLMNEKAFHQDATTTVTQNSICCLACEIPLWIGALYFFPGASCER